MASDLANDVFGCALPHIIVFLHPSIPVLQALRGSVRGVAAVLEDGESRRSLLNVAAGIIHLAPLRPKASVLAFELLRIALQTLRADVDDPAVYGAAAECVLMHAAPQLELACFANAQVLTAFRRYVWMGLPLPGAPCEHNAHSLVCQLMSRQSCSLEACKLLYRVGLDRPLLERLVELLSESTDAATLEWGFAVIFSMPEWTLADGLEVRLRDALCCATERTSARDIHLPGMGLHSDVCTRWWIAAQRSAAHTVVDFLDAIGPLCSFPELMFFDEAPDVPALLTSCRGRSAKPQLILVVLEAVGAAAAPTMSAIMAARTSGLDVVLCPVPQVALRRESARMAHFKLYRAAGRSLRFVLSDLARRLDAACEAAGVCSLPF